MRTLIYARYSSHLQNPRSVEDQLAACRARCAAEGWAIAGEFHDRAISGAAGIGEDQRPGLAKLLAALEAGGVARVLTEHTDRIARHQGDAFAVRERIEHAGARLVTLMQGEIDDLTGGIHSIFDAKQRKDLAARVRRGHRGRVAQGLASGGVAYGYRKVARFDDRGEPIRGLREIDPEKAEIVLRIFREYAAGASARAIAAALNAEGIPPPRGAIWRSSTLAGHRSSGFGILANPVYTGRLVYGRTRAVTDPRTRRRKMVAAGREGSPGSSSEAIAQQEVPHLRIVPEDLWQAVQAQLEARSTGSPERQRRPRHLLSGLGECGLCGGKWIVTRGRYFGCGTWFEGKACTNRRLIAKDEFERRVLAELEAQMLAPEAVEAYLDEYRREHARRAREAGQDRTRAERRRAEAGRKVARLVAAVADGGGEFAEIREALAAAKAEQAAADKALAAADALPQLALHPGLARQYRAAIANLAAELSDEAARREAAPRLRALIARVVVTPAEGQRGVRLEVIRHVDEVLALATRRTA